MNTNMKRYIRNGTIFLLIALIGLTILAIPGVVTGNRAANRMVCTSNLHGLWLSIYTYPYRNEVKINHEILPFYGDKTTGEEYWSWRAIWIQREYSHNTSPEYRLTEPWNSEHNLSLIENPRFNKEHSIRYFYCHSDQQKEKSSYVAVKGPGTVWTEMENGNLPGGFLDYPEMILIIETTEPKNHWAEPGDDVTPEEVIRLFEADPGLVKNSKQGWWDTSHWPKNYVRADGLAENFREIKDVEELRKLLIISPEKIEEVRKKVEERERMSQQ